MRWYSRDLAGYESNLLVPTADMQDRRMAGLDSARQNKPVCHHAVLLPKNADTMGSKTDLSRHGRTDSESIELSDDHVPVTSVEEHDAWLKTKEGQKALREWGGGALSPENWNSMAHRWAERS